MVVLLPPVLKFITGSVGLIGVTVQGRAGIQQKPKLS